LRSIEKKQDIKNEEPGRRHQHDIENPVPCRGDTANLELASACLSGALTAKNIGKLSDPAIPDSANHQQQQKYLNDDRAVDCIGCRDQQAYNTDLDDDMHNGAPVGNWIDLGRSRISH
jgi:hypothetical protein